MSDSKNKSNNFDFRESLSNNEGQVNIGENINNTTNNSTNIKNKLIKRNYVLPIVLIGVVLIFSLFLTSDNDLEGQWVITDGDYCFITIDEGSGAYLGSSFDLKKMELKDNKYYFYKDDGVNIGRQGEYEYKDGEVKLYDFPYRGNIEILKVERNEDMITLKNPNTSGKCTFQKEAK